MGHVQEEKIVLLHIPPLNWISKSKLQIDLFIYIRLYNVLKSKDIQMITICYNRYRSRNNRQCTAMENNANEYNNGSICGDGSSSNSSVRALSPRGPGHHNNHSQFNSTNIQLPSQPHPPSNSSGIMAGGSAHRMPSPAPSMRVPPLMSAVSPMTAPVAQVAPVPRGFDHNQNQPMSQVDKS